MTDQDNTGQKVGDFIENLELLSEGDRLDPKNPFVVRLDGHGFSKFTKGFQKPFDRFLADTMIMITGELVERFNARTGYTQSDEITLVFAAMENDEPHIFAGRKQKLCSLIAGFASARFNHNLALLTQDYNNKALASKKDSVYLNK